MCFLQVVRNCADLQELRMIRRQLLTSIFALLACVAMGLPHAQAQDRQHLVFLFQKQKDPEKIRAGAERLAALLSKELGREVRVIVPVDYAASVQALVSRQADVAYVSALPFLLARRDGGAKLLLAEERVDAAGKARTDYDSIVVAPANSPLRSMADVKRQAKSLRLAFTSPTSTSGYVFPYLRFIREGMLRPKQNPAEAFRQVMYGGSYTQALEQVVAGRADIATVSDYTMEGPKADVYLPAAERAKLKVIGRTPGVPTHLVAARAGLDPKLEARISAALLKVAAQNPDLLADVYGASRFVRVNERRHVQSAVDAITKTGIPIEGLAR
jgi:phosphonate transport system substrate-binding protein